MSSKSGVKIIDRKPFLSDTLYESVSLNIKKFVKFTNVYVNRVENGNLCSTIVEV